MRSPWIITPPIRGAVIHLVQNPEASGRDRVTGAARGAQSRPQADGETLIAPTSVVAVMT